MPAASAAATLASAVPRVSWKWYACRSSGMPAAVGERHELGDLVRDADPDRVAEADLVDTELDEPFRDRDRGGGLDATGIRAAEGCRDVGPPPPAELGRTGEDRSERSERRIHGHPDVVLGERVRGCREHGDRVDSGNFGARHAPLVRDEDREADAASSGERRHQLVRIGQLGDRRG